MANDPNSLKFKTKWFETEARGRWGIIAALLNFFAGLAAFSLA